MREPGQAGAETGRGDIHLGWDTAAGKKRYKWVTLAAATKQEAEQELSHLVAQYHAGTLPQAPAKLTAGEYLDRWLSESARARVTRKTHQGYEQVVAHLTPVLGTRPLAKLTPLDVQRVYNDLREQGRQDGRGPLSPTTLLYYHRVLHRALAQAVKWGLVSRNVADAVEAPRAHRAVQGEAPQTACAAASPPVPPPTHPRQVAPASPRRTRVASSPPMVLRTSNASAAARSFRGRRAGRANPLRPMRGRVSVTMAARGAGAAPGLASRGGLPGEAACSISTRNSGPSPERSVGRAARTRSPMGSPSVSTRRRARRRTSTSCSPRTASRGASCRNESVGGACGPSRWRGSGRSNVAGARLKTAPTSTRSRGGGGRERGRARGS